MERLDQHDNGATGVDYALIAALIALATIAVLLALGADIKLVFEEIREVISDL